MKKLFVFASIFAALGVCSAHAQLHHPFAIGASEGSIGHQNALGAWLIAQESRAYQALEAGVRATKASWAGFFGLVAVSFAYGVSHAAGPGHGKAVITSYVVSNESALKRGLAISFCAALLQGVLAIGLVAAAGLLFHATAHSMTQAAQTIEFCSYLAVAALGGLLCWRKGTRLVEALWPDRSNLSLLFAAAPAGLAVASGGSGRFRVDNGIYPHDETCRCGALHDAATKMLAAQRFDPKEAALAVVTAGARPCSGAILILVFTLSQGMFAAGIAATMAMALGTGTATGGLAVATVFAKERLMRAAAFAPHSATIIGRVIELLAAALVLLMGLLLLAAWLQGFRGGTVS